MPSLAAAPDSGEMRYRNASQLNASEPLANFENQEKAERIRPPVPLEETQKNSWSRRTRND